MTAEGVVVEVGWLIKKVEALEKVVDEIPPGEVKEMMSGDITKKMLGAMVLAKITQIFAEYLEVDLKKSIKS